jgi:hypothetical protein
MNSLLIAVSLSLFPAAAAFQSGGDLAAWDILDYEGDGLVERRTVVDCPPGYGPDVLHISGTLGVLLAKGGHLGDGTYVALYRERAAATKDADGVILFGGAYGNDVALEHNTKTVRPHLWLEQDNDTGFSFRRAPETGEDFSIAESVATGLVTDSWNVTGWIWQKVQVSGESVQAKYWPAQAAEPPPDAFRRERRCRTGNLRFLQRRRYGTGSRNPDARPESSWWRSNGAWRRHVSPRCIAIGNRYGVDPQLPRVPPQ